MKKYSKSGWYGENYRHYLAAKGITTNKYYARGGRRVRAARGLLGDENVRVTGLNVTNRFKPMPDENTKRFSYALYAKYNLLLKTQGKEVADKFIQDSRNKFDRRKSLLSEINQLNEASENVSKDDPQYAEIYASLKQQYLFLGMKEEDADKQAEISALNVIAENYKKESNALKKESEQLFSDLTSEVGAFRGMKLARRSSGRAREPVRGLASVTDPVTGGEKYVADMKYGVLLPSGELAEWSTNSPEQAKAVAAQWGGKLIDFKEDYGAEIVGLDIPVQSTTLPNEYRLLPGPLVTPVLQRVEKEQKEQVNKEKLLQSLQPDIMRTVSQRKIAKGTPLRTTEVVRKSKEDPEQEKQEFFQLQLNRMYAELAKEDYPTLEQSAAAGRALVEKLRKDPATAQAGYNIQQRIQNTAEKETRSRFVRPSSKYNKILDSSESDEGGMKDNESPQ